MRLLSQHELVPCAAANIFGPLGVQLHLQTGENKESGLNNKLLVQGEVIHSNVSVETNDVLKANTNQSVSQWRSFSFQIKNNR